MSYKKVAEILAQAKEAICHELENDSDAAHHKLKIETALQREIDYVGLLTGTADLSPADVKHSPPPATTMGGQPIKRPASPITTEDLEPDQRKLAELKEKVETVYQTFVTRDSKDILKTVDDTTIRGVAKKAKMKVTKDDPETITLQFVEEIKDAIRMENARQVAADEQRENEQHLAKKEAAEQTAEAEWEKEEKNNLPEFKNPLPPPPKKDTKPAK